MFFLKTYHNRISLAFLLVSLLIFLPVLSAEASGKGISEKITNIITDAVTEGLEKIEKKLDSKKVKETGHDIADVIVEGIRKIEGELIGENNNVKKIDATVAAEAINSFTFSLYKTLSGVDKGDLFFSPYSILSALGMTYAGAGGNTALEMEGALHFPGSEIHASMGALVSRLGNISDDMGVLATANRLWVTETEKLRFPYARLLQEDYRSDVAVLNFAKDPEGSRKIINAWVEQKTNNRIKELLRSGNVGHDTVLVLTNAVYFNSLWSLPFKAQNTKPLPFRVTKDKVRDLPTMFQQNNFLYNEVDGVQIVRLPYKLPGFSMFILLPRVTEAFDQLHTLEKTLWSDKGVSTLKSWIDGMKEQKLDLWLPKFQQEQRFSLNEPLAGMGMKEAFGSNADFSGMLELNKTNNAPIYINAVIHQTFVAVDEEKTEAAASTAVTIMRMSMPIPEEGTEFRADHPFLYMIMDDATGTILFFGRQGFAPEN